MLEQQSLDFLEDLKINNNREWFLENKKRYESYKKDYQQLVQSVLTEMKKHDNSLAHLEVKNCVFRINRDIRFSKDKSPYKTHLGIWISSGSKNKNRSGYYIHIEKDKSFIAGGFYAPESEDLKKIRKEIAFFHDDLVKILEEKKLKNEFGSFVPNDTNCLKNPPRGYEKEHPAIDWLKFKSFELTQSVASHWVTQPNFAQEVSDKLAVLKPLNDFLNRAVTTEF
jgi:uncharacterized protein (TIGR02453 family)